MTKLEKSMIALMMCGIVLTLAITVIGSVLATTWLIFDNKTMAVVVAALVVGIILVETYAYEKKRTGSN